MNRLQALCAVRTYVCPGHPVPGWCFPVLHSAAMLSTSWCPLHSHGSHLLDYRPAWSAFLLPYMCVRVHAGNPGCDATSLQRLSALTKLTSLCISGSGVDNHGFAAIAAALPQLQHLDVANNRVSKVDTLSGLVSLSGLSLSRNPLQINCAKVLATATPQSLALFDAVSAKAVAHLAGGALAQHVTNLTLGADPSINPEGTENLPLAKTRTCSSLFGSLAEAGQLQVLSVPCCGLGDAQCKLIGKLGGCLKAVNLR